MSDLATLAEQAVRNPATKPEPSSTVRQIFMVLHGAYGSLFLSKFSTGDLDASGKDKGVRSAMLVWDSALREYPEDVVQAAARRALEESPDYPPTLPQLLARCRALTPRVAFTAPRPALPAPAPVPFDFDRKHDGLDWARQIQASAKARNPVSPMSLMCAAAALKGRE